ncbi:MULTISPECIES: hypothetical protein [Galbibacter]|uniref:hypothetical protein n=1 Tax=Galbibacter orientalis TaxID=453852 RepID=UPI00300148A1
MAYNNNYRRNNGYNRGGYNQNYRQAPPPPPKKSGAKYTIIRKGKYEGGTIINAWNKSKSKGLITAKIAPYSGTSEYTAKTSGKTYQTMIAEVTYTKSGHTRLLPCSMNINTKVVVLSDIGMVVTPNGSGVTASGKRVTGYFGTMMRR